MEKIFFSFYNFDLFYIFFIFSIFIFVLGLWGIVVSARNFINLLICIEIMFLGVVLLFIFFSLFFEDFKGQLFAIIVLTVAAAESSIALAAMVSFYRVVGTIDLLNANLLRN